MKPIDYIIITAIGLVLCVVFFLALYFIGDITEPDRQRDRKLWVDITGAVICLAIFVAICYAIALK